MEKCDGLDTPVVAEGMQVMDKEAIAFHPTSPTH